VDNIAFGSYETPTQTIDTTLKRIGTLDTSYMKTCYTIKSLKYAKFYFTWLSQHDPNIRT
jgi:hypothetical protein